MRGEGALGPEVERQAVSDRQSVYAVGDAAGVGVVPLGQVGVEVPLADVVPVGRVVELGGGEAIERVGGQVGLGCAPDLAVEPGQRVVDGDGCGVAVARELAGYPVEVQRNTQGDLHRV